MSEEIVALGVRLIEEAWNKGKLDVIDEVCAANWVSHDPASPDVRTREEYKQFIVGTRTAYPDVNITIEDTFAEGNKAAMRYTFRGTHSGESPTFGIPATGKQVTFTGISISHVADGRIVETWGVWDALGSMRQLGVIPSRG